MTEELDYWLSILKECYEKFSPLDLSDKDCRELSSLLDELKSKREELGEE